MSTKSKLMGGWAYAWAALAPRSTVLAGATEIRVTTRDLATRGIANWQPDWKTSLIAAILQSRPGLFVDIGANIGQTLLDWVAANSTASYIGFEPNSVCVAHLNHLIDDNKLTSARVVPCGLSDESGVVNLHVMNMNGADAAATIVRELNSHEFRAVMPISVHRFDDVRPSLPQETISLVKVDVEGAEEKVLGGMAKTIRSERPWVLCEVLHRAPTADHEIYLQRVGRLMSLISTLGYEAHRVEQTPDQLGVRGLTRITSFPDIVYTSASQDNCDYLLVPAADYDTAQRALHATGKPQ